ncbi:MAG TPA: uroporphyrinogen decarboxylase family protein [Candidatus Hydrogenedentes bacterium]|nr:uroporphyrinogen decarboxylase family protein [Candidatus Hydrogenedentota bacterium]
MNTREQFLEVMKFNKGVPALKWEFGYWGETVKNWYAAGLPKEKPPYPSPAISTPTSSLYSAAWTCQGPNYIPNGTGVMAGGLYWPTQGFPLDYDVRKACRMDPPQRILDVNLLFEPMFDIEVIEEDEKKFFYQDLDGAKRVLLKGPETIPTTMEWPVKDRKSWEQLKKERLRLDDISGRFPANWDALVEEYKNRDYPLAIGGYPFGLFGTPSHILGYDKIFLLYCEDPDFVHDIMNTFAELFLRVCEEALHRVQIDHVHFWEDISFGAGPMVSLDIVREYMVPYYKRIIAFLKQHGVEVILLDTDGDCNKLIPIYLEAGITGMYPFETHCGMDIVKVRKEYPQLQMCGGVPKAEIAKGRDAIDRALKPVAEVLKTGGFIPFGDHFIPPDVGWEDFQYYRRRLNELIDMAAV